MPRVTNEDYDILQADFELSEKLRMMNYEAILQLLAENILFRSIITGISMKPLEAILRDGRPIIEAEYKRLQKVYEDVDVFIDELG